MVGQCARHVLDISSRERIVGVHEKQESAARNTRAGVPRERRVVPFRGMDHRQRQPVLVALENRDGSIR